MFADVEMTAARTKEHEEEKHSRVRTENRKQTRRKEQKQEIVLKACRLMSRK